MILEGYKVSKISEKDMMDIISNLGLVYDERFMVINVFRDGVVLETQNLVLDFDGRNLFLYENRQIYEEIKYTKQKDIVDKWNSTLTKKILYHDNLELLRKKI
jgi:hypothetical protein